MSDAKLAVEQKSKGVGCLRWAGRIAAGILILLIVLAAAGAIYQALASASDAKLFKPMDQMVNVNGIQMRLDCRGNGGPTVVLEAGASSSSISWARLQDDVAKFTRVCSYDRAGLGWSDSVGEALLPQQIARQLHDLLESGREQPPYLMVGHSLGGIYVRAFEAEFPEDVVGMVLVDSSHENQIQRFPPEMVELSEMQLTSFRMCMVTAPIGFVRAFKLMDVAVESLPVKEEEKAPLLAEMNRTGFCGAAMREMEMFSAFSSQPRELKSLGDLPLIVLSAAQDAQKMYDQLPAAFQAQLTVEMLEEQVEAWDRMQAELTALSTRGRRIVVTESGHNIQLEAPQVVIDAIREVFEQAVR